MLKIPKGLKKKKKGKKSKKKGEEELFTEEELEQYRREHQAQAQSQAQPEEQQVNEEGHSQDQPKPNSDEWSKFNALTTGVDSILKKTQGDLDRIKSTSFFQRVPTGAKTVDRGGKELPIKRKDGEKEGQGWIDFEKEKATENKQQQQQESTHTVVTEAEPVSEAAFSESESEEEFDDIFDTSFVEAVEKGEVKLAYIPDSPDEVEEEGPDPFDTSYAEKVIKGPEVSKKGKKLVNIGSAVEVLTGRLDTVIKPSASIKRPKRRVPRDLLFESADPDDVDAAVEETTASKSLLDDDTEIVDSAPIDLSVSLHTQFIKKEDNEEKDRDDKQKEVLSEFDVIVDDDDDEFAQLATESLNKPVVEAQPIAPQLSSETVLEDSWAAFADSKQKPNRPPPPKSVQNAETDESPSEFDEGPDPFDTTFAENIVPGKAELKHIENEILNDSSDLKHSDSDFDFNPREGEKPYVNNRKKSLVHIHVTDPAGLRESISGLDHEENSEVELKPIHRDLLGGSTTDLSQLVDVIAPSALDSENIDYSDPFDTSIVDSITAPGKTELKFIEQELLEETESEIKRSLSDLDFDPRAEEKAEACRTAPRKPSRPENLFVNKAVLFDLPSENSIDGDKNSKKPVTPYYNREASVTEEDNDTQEDPFDTTSPILIHESDAKPVTSILKKSSVEFTVKKSLSNQDLNAEEDFANEKSFSQLRRHSDFPINFSNTAGLEPLKNKTDFLSIAEEESVDAKVLTPYQESRDSIDLDVDPFDTSIVNSILLPGKTELKFLESELLSQQATSNHLLDPDFDPRAGENTNKEPQDLLAPSDDVFQIKALTPEIPETATGFLIGTEEDEIDPFDTSIADNIKPGKTELKLLENEFIN